jgi:hypothetical protein
VDLVDPGPFSALLDHGRFARCFKVSRTSTLSFHTDDTVVIQLLHHIEVFSFFAHCYKLAGKF